MDKRGIIRETGRLGQYRHAKLYIDGSAGEKLDSLDLSELASLHASIVPRVDLHH